MSTSHVVETDGQKYEPDEGGEQPGGNVIKLFFFVADDKA
jgi:hypothetical protein